MSPGTEVPEGESEREPMSIREDTTKEIIGAVAGAIAFLLVAMGIMLTCSAGIEAYREHTAALAKERHSIFGVIDKVETIVDPVEKDRKGIHIEVGVCHQFTKVWFVDGRVKTFNEISDCELPRGKPLAIEYDGLQRIVSAKPTESKEVKP